MKQTQITNNLKAHFLRLYRMAICDDNFSEFEIKMLYQFAEDRNIPKDELDRILLNPIDGNEHIPDTMESKIEFLYDLTQMIWADNEVTPDEIELLEKYIKLFGFVEENISEIAEYFIQSIQSNKPLTTIIQEIA